MFHMYEPNAKIPFQAIAAEQLKSYLNVYLIFEGMP